MAAVNVLISYASYDNISIFMVLYIFPWANLKGAHLKYVHYRWNVVEVEWLRKTCEGGAKINKISTPFLPSNMEVGFSSIHSIA